MRITTLLRNALGLKHTRALGFEFEHGDLIVDVEPTTRVPICGGCLRRVRQVYDARPRTWRHLDLWGVLTRLRFGIRRLDCPRCGVTTELVPWAEPGSGFTQPFEDRVGYLAQRCDQTTVSKLMRVAWATVGRIIARVADRLRPLDPLEGLTHIGIDELSYRRHDEYVTIVMDHVFHRIVWAAPGKNADTLRGFFDDLGPDRAANLKVVTIDMAARYALPVRERAPQAQIVFDRFHVQRLVHDALDEVRRAQVRECKGTPRGRAIKRTRKALQRNPWNLTSHDRERLATLERRNKPLYRAYLLKESFADILDRRQVHVARRKLDEWIAWASRSKLQPFVKAARTVRRHKEGILAYIQTGLSNGPLEGLNGKARTLTRRAYGFHALLAGTTFWRILPRFRHRARIPA